MLDNSPEIIREKEFGGEISPPLKRGKCEEKKQRSDIEYKYQIVVTTYNGGMTLDAGQIVQMFLELYYVKRYLSFYYVYSGADGIWKKYSKEEIKRLVTSILTKQEKSVWTVAIRP